MDRLPASEARRRGAPRNSTNTLQRPSAGGTAKSYIYYASPTPGLRRSLQTPQSQFGAGTVPLWCSGLLPRHREQRRAIKIRLTRRNPRQNPVPSSAQLLEREEPRFPPEPRPVNAAHRAGNAARGSAAKPGQSRATPRRAPGWRWRDRSAAKRTALRVSWSPLGPARAGGGAGAARA